MRVELYATHDRFYVYVPDADDLKVVNNYCEPMSCGCTGRDRCSADMDYIEALEYDNGEWLGELFKIDNVGELVYADGDRIVVYGEIPTHKIIEYAKAICVSPLADDEMGGIVENPSGIANPDYYQVTTEQPIQIMREIMSQDEFIGFLWGNIIKYSMRMKRKDNPISEAKKIKQYATWLVNVYDGKELEGIDSHKEDNDNQNN